MRKTIYENYKHKNNEELKLLMLSILDGAYYASSEYESQISFPNSPEINKDKIEEHFQKLSNAVAIEAVNSLVRHVLYKSALDNELLQWISTLYKNPQPKTGAELIVNHRDGEIYWELIYYGGWRQGGYRYINEIDLGFPFPQLEKVSQERLKIMQQLKNGIPQYK